MKLLSDEGHVFNMSAMNVILANISISSVENMRLYVIQLMSIWFTRRMNSHYCDVIMETMASKITSLTIVYSAVYLGTDQRKHQSSASLAFVCTGDRWIPRTNGQ